jgi:hypothetical protein
MGLDNPVVDHFLLDGLPAQISAKNTAFFPGKLIIEVRDQLKRGGYDEAYILSCVADTN